VTIAALAVLLIVAVVAAIRAWQQKQILHRKYSPILDIQGEARRIGEEAAHLLASATTDVERLRATAKVETDQLRTSTKAELYELRTATQVQVTELKQQRETLSQEYASARALYDHLKKELALVEEHVEDISVGLYEPHYTYPSSQAYKSALDDVCERQKLLVKAGQAAVCGHVWEIQGDKRAGERMTKQYLKLVLRAFNGECDAATARVTWNNITKMEERIRKTYEAINELGKTMDMRITPEYLNLRVEELRLEHEYAEKKREEQEEQRQIRERMREEERAVREAEKARREAEEDEERSQRALEQARAELAQARGEALEQLQLRIQHLDAALHRAHEMKEKATSMAMLTRSGHVYVISNVGSLGENVFKIGMTRRLDPMDRIWELSDASVPFDFDVHAMIYCEDAPSLENHLQTRFRERALNLVNSRKEFFSVSIDEIEEAARQRGLTLALTKVAEAKEYKQTLALRTKGVEIIHMPVANDPLPASL
jgi:hypothetical protein